MKRIAIIVGLLLYTCSAWAQFPPQGVLLPGGGGGGGRGGSGTVSQGNAGDVPYYPSIGTTIGPVTGVPHGVFLFEPPGPPVSTGAGSDEQILTGITGADPQFLTIGGDITATAISGGTLLLTNAKLNGAIPGGGCSGSTPFVASLNSQAIPTCMGATTSPSFRGFTLLGSTSGSDVIGVPAVAGTGTIFNFPANNGSAGQFLQVDGAGNTSWANFAGGGTVNSGTINQLGYYASTGTTISSNANATISNGALTLGQPGIAAGILNLSGTTSGTFALAAPTAITSYTLTVPAAAGAQGSFLYSSNGAGTLANLTAGTSGQLLIGQGATTVPNWVTGSGDCTISNTGVFNCIKTGGVAFAASATTDTTVASNISSGTLAAARLPNPTSSTLGGVESLAAVSHNWINTISTSGVPSATRPASTDLSDLPIPLTSGGTQCAGVSHVAGLPGSPVKGQICSVDDATTCTAGTPVAAGGSTYCLAVWDGAAWQPAGGASSAASGGVTAVNATAPITSSGGTTPSVGITVPSCPTTGGTQALNFSGSSFSCNTITATAPGGSSGQIEYNNAGAFGGFTVGGDGTLVPSTGILTITKLNNTTPGGTCSGATPLVASINGSAVPACMATTVTPHFGAITSGANGGTGGSLVLNGATSGSVTVAAAANAGSGTSFVLPNSNGTASQFLQTDGSGNTSWQTVTGGGGGVSSITAGTGLTGGTITTSGTIALAVPVTAPNGGTGVVSPAAHGVMLGEGAAAMASLACAANTVLAGAGGAVDPTCTTTPTLGVAGTSNGKLSLTGSTSGTVTIAPQVAAGTYNFNLPTTAGTSGQPLLSGGGVAAPMTFGTLGVGAGGTGLTSGTSGGVPYFNSGSTMASSAALTANQPVIGGGAGIAPTVGSKSGNTNVFATQSGATVLGDVPKYDSNGNLVDSGVGPGGGGSVVSVTASSPLASSGGSNPNISISVPIPVANGGTGTSTPATLAGTGITVTGSFPAQTVGLTTPVAVANGGTGTASPGTVAGTGITVTGSFPTQTVALTTPVTVANGGTQCGAPTVFGSLPGSPTAGELCTVTDAPTCTAGTAVSAGGGSTVCQVSRIGSSWLPAGGATSAAAGGVTAVNASAPIASSGGTTPTISLTGTVPVANGGTGTASPATVAGTGILVSGSFPNQTIALSTPVTVANGGTQCGAPSIFASLPGSPTAGETCTVTDATSCTAGTAITVGGGSTVCQITRIGSSWLPAGGAGSAASGGVTSVNATAPITSSGGTTPTIGMTNPLPVANGGTGSATPGTIAGTGVSITGSFPTQTVALATPVSIANGGTGSTTAAGTAGTGLSVSGTFPNQQYALQVPVSVANGGTGTATPALAAGAGISITGTWPNNTIAATGGGGGFNNIATVITGTTAGTATCYTPIQQTSLGEVTCKLVGYLNSTATTQTYSYQGGYTFGLPPVFTQQSNPPSSASTTTLSLPVNMTAAFTGYVILEGTQ